MSKNPKSIIRAGLSCEAAHHSNMKHSWVNAPHWKLLPMILLALLLAGAARAAIAVQNTVRGNYNNAQSYSIANPVTFTPGGAGMLIVTVGGEAGNVMVNSVTWNDAPMTLAAGTTGGTFQYIYYLVNPTVGSGTLTVNLSGGTTRSMVSAIYATGVGALESWATNASATSADLIAGPVATSAGSLVVNAGAHSQGPLVSGGIVGGGDTRIFLATSGDAGGSGTGASYQISAGGAKSAQWFGPGVQNEAVAIASFAPAVPGIPDLITAKIPATGGGAWGSYSSTGPGSYTIMAGGNDIWDTADDFTFHYEQVTGDFDVRCRMDSVDGTHMGKWAKNGIMARESVANNSRMAFNRVSPFGPVSNGGTGLDNTGFGFRTGPNGSGGQHEDGNGTLHRSPWIRLLRTGNLVKIYSSVDGLKWLGEMTQDTATWNPGALNQTLLVGLAMSRHSGAFATAEVKVSHYANVQGSGSGAPVVTKAPVSQDVAPGVSLPLSADIAGGYDYAAFQWQSNGVAIANATNIAYSTPSLDEGTTVTYSLVISNKFNSQTTTVSAVIRSLPFVTTSAANLGLTNGVSISFSADLDYTSALVPADYVVKDASGAAIPAVSVTPGMDNKKVVVLLGGRLLPKARYTVQVSNVKSAANQTIVPSSISFTYGTLPGSGLVRNHYNGWIGGNLTVDLFANSKFKAGTPDVVETLSSIDDDGYGSNDYWDHYRGYIIPQETANYNFFASSDDNSELFISTDSDPINKRYICGEPSWAGWRDWGQRPDATTVPVNTWSVANYPNGIRMVAGQNYAFDFFIHQGGGGDPRSVTWTKFGEANPGNGSAATLGGIFVGRDLTGAAVPQMAAVTSAPIGRTVEENSSARFDVVATGNPAPTYQWYFDGVAIAGATRSYYAIPIVSPTNAGNYTVVVQNGITKITTPPAQLVVNADTVAPTFYYAKAFYNNPTQILLKFSEYMDEATATDFNLYTLTDGIGNPITINSLTFGQNPSYVIVHIDPLTPLVVGQTYSLEIGNVNFGGISDRALVPNYLNPTPTVATIHLNLPGFDADFNDPPQLDAYLKTAGNVFGMYLSPLINGFIDQEGGVNNSGVFKMALNVNGAGGSLVTTELTPNIPVTRFTAKFKVHLGEGSGNPADGFSFNFGNDLPTDSTPGDVGGFENGKTATGLSVSYTFYNADKISIKYAGVTKFVDFTQVYGFPGYVDAVVQLKEDGLLDVSFNGRQVCQNLATGYMPMTGKFGFYGRSGGENANEWIDDILITNIFTPGPLSFTQEPVSQTVGELQTVAFHAAVQGTPPYAVQWFLNGAPVAGATAWSYSFPATTDMNNALVSVQVTAPDASVLTSTNAVLTVIPDTTAPTVVAVSADPFVDGRVKVTFSKPVIKAEAEDGDFIYLVDGMITPNSGSVVASADQRSVTMQFATSFAASALHNLAILDNQAQIHDTTTAANVLGATNLNFYAWARGQTGVLHVDQFTGMSGNNDMTMLTNHSTFPFNPEARTTISEYNFNPGTLDNSGARIQGYIIPTETANYQFEFSHDDAAWFMLSTDDTAANRRTILNVIPCCGPQQNETPTRLEAGKMYYTEALYQNGTGGNYITVRWRKLGDSSYVTIPGSVLAYAINAKDVLAQQPTNTTIYDGWSAQFSIKTGPSYGPYTMQWQKFEAGAYVDIVGQTSATLVTQPLFMPESGARYRCIVTLVNPAGNFVVESLDAVVTIIPDTVAPYVLSVAPQANNSNIVIRFSERIRTATAANLANYVFSDGIQVLGAAQNAAGDIITLATTEQDPGPHTLAFGGLTDNATVGNHMVPDPTVVTYTNVVTTFGAIKYERYDNISGTAVQMLLDDPSYINHQPTIVGTLTAFNYGPDVADNYGLKMFGYFMPQVSGNYSFFTSSDDASQVFVSTDMNPAHKVLAALENGCCGGYVRNSSVTIPMVAGEAYYMEAFVKEGGGGDYLRVGYALNGGAAPSTPIGALEMASVAPFGASPVTITQTLPATATRIEGESLSLTVAATSPSGQLVYQWQVNGVNIPGAGSATLVVPRVELTDSGNIYKVKVLDPNGGFAFNTTTLTVEADTVQPTVLGVGAIHVTSRLTNYVKIADSGADWDLTGLQGVNGWTSGYYDATADATPGYQVADFTAFTIDQFTNGMFDLAVNTAPWTEVGQYNVHPNGTNNANLQWAMRRWVSTTNGNVDVLWWIRKNNTGCGGGVAGKLFLNGTLIDALQIAGNNAAGFSPTVTIPNIQVGDIIDIALTAEDQDGTFQDPCDGSYMGAQVYYNDGGYDVIGINFSERVDANVLNGTATDPYAYTVNGLNPSYIEILTNEHTVRLTGFAAPIGPTFEIQITGVQDQYLNVMDDVSLIGTNIGLTAISVGVAGDPSMEGLVVPLAGDAMYAAGSGTDIWDVKDGFSFAYKQVTGDFDVRMRVAHVDPINNWAKSGLMIRENLSAGSRNVSLITDPANVPTVDGGTGANMVEVNWRAVQDTGTGNFDFAPRTAPNFPNAWVRLVRAGDRITAFRSADGIVWTNIADQTISPLLVKTFVGAVLTSHNQSYAASTEQDNFRFVERPTWVTEPTPAVQTNDVSTAVSLTGLAAGETVTQTTGTSTTPELVGISYQWLRNGQFVPGATSATFSTPSITEAEQGDYQLVARNSAGAITSIVTHVEVNQIPLAPNQAVADTENQQITFTLGASDPDGNPFIVVVASQPKFGTLIVNPITHVADYRPNPKFNGTDTFTYYATDGSVTSAVATVSINVAFVNDIPSYAFAAGTTIPVTNMGLQSVIVGDYNRDSKLDVAVADSEHNEVRILLGNGKGGLTTSNAPAPMPVGMTPVALVQADFNKDTYMDLASINAGSSSISFLKGTQYGYFGVDSTLMLDSSPTHAVVAEFGSDARVDLAVVSSNANTVSIYANTLAGWALTNVLDVAGSPVAIAAGDLNMDGKKDLVVANYASNTVTILLARGNGFFTNDPAITLPVGQGPVAVAIADVNGDGSLDIVAANKNSDDITVYTNDGSGVFALAGNFGVQANIGWQPSSLVVADFNKDGKADVGVTLQGDNRFLVLNGNGNGTFNFYWNDTSSLFEVGSQPVSAATGDFDADKATDVVVANLGSGDLTMLLNSYAPVAYSQSVSVDQNTTKVITLAASVNDLSYYVTKAPLHGSFTAGLMQTNGTQVLVGTNAGPSLDLSYTPSQDFFGTDSIEFYVTDTIKTSKVAKVSITVKHINQRPSFTLSTNLVVVYDDSGAFHYPLFAKNISAGPANEKSQTLKFVVTCVDPTQTKWFNRAAQPRIDNYGVLTLTPQGPFVLTNTVIPVTVYLKDNGTTNASGAPYSVTNQFNIEIKHFNAAPTMSKILPITARMNSGEGYVPTTVFVAIKDSETAGASLTLTVDSSNTGLLPAGSIQIANAVGGKFVTFTPALSQVGTALLTFTVTDADGGRATVSGVQFSVQQYPMLHFAFNPLLVAQESAAVVLPGFVTSMTSVPNVMYALVSVSNTKLFTVTPTITTTGTLKFQPVRYGVGRTNVSGLVTVTVRAFDPANPAVSATNSFVIDIYATNTAPVITAAIGTQTVQEDAAAFTVAFRATDRETPAGLTSAAVSSDPTVATVVSSIDANGNGTVTITPQLNANGAVWITNTVTDSGIAGVGNKSVVNAFRVVIAAVNDAPSFTLETTTVTVPVNAPAQSLNIFAGVTAGPANEATQAVSFKVDGAYDHSLFKGGSVTVTGSIATGFNLVFTPAGFVGTTTVFVYANDNNGTANFGNDKSPSQAITITITP